MHKVLCFLFGHRWQFNDRWTYDPSDKRIVTEVRFTRHCERCNFTTTRHLEWDGKDMVEA